MPFLSRLVLDVRSRQARRDLASPYELHRTLWRAFPQGDPGRVLYRVEPEPQAAPAVLVQSDRGPDWAKLPDPGYLLKKPEVKEFDPELSAGQRLKFRLRANPTKRVSPRDPELGASMAGKRIALLREEDQVGWLVRKGEEGGFAVVSFACRLADGRTVTRWRVDVFPEGWVRCDKDGHRGGRFYSARFEGLLEVTDPAAFRGTLAEGVGAAKGFGFGLLSVARA